jgi:hypothetical protein
MLEVYKDLLVIVSYNLLHFIDFYILSFFFFFVILGVELGLVLDRHAF